MSINILIINDYPLVRKGLKCLLEKNKDFKVTAETGKIEDAILQIKKCKPDIVLVDINISAGSNMEMLKKIRSKEFPVKIIIFTAYDAPDYMNYIIEYGFDGYVMKNIELEALEKVIYTVYDNKVYIQQEIVEQRDKIYNTRETELKKLKSLTDRESEVLKLIAEGLFNKEIASKLSISERTVKNHISNVFKKIDVADRTQAAVFAIRNNLVNIKNNVELSDK